MAWAVAIRLMGTDVRGHPKKPYRTWSPDWSAVTRIRLKVATAMVMSSSNPTIHGSASCVSTRATSSVARLNSSGHLADRVELQYTRSPGASCITDGAASELAVRLNGSDDATQAAMPPATILPPIHTISALGARVASCHRSSPRWSMAVVARIPAESAPTNAPTNETVGATNG